MKRKTAIKTAALAVLIAAAFYLTRYGFLSENLTREGIRMAVSSAGVLAPLAYIILYIGGAVFLVPGTLITAAGAVAFGTLWGTIYTLAWATLGASAAFLLARWLGRDFVSNFVEDRWKKLREYDDKLEDYGFATIFYLRLIFFPFNALNFGAGLTKVRFRDYFWGTLLGIIPGTFIFVFFFDSITAIDSFGDLLHWKIILAVVLFATSFTIPIIVKKFNKRVK